MKKILASTAIVCALLGFALAAPAAEKPGGDQPAKERKVGHIPFKGKVSAVDAAAKTISIEGKEKPRVFYVTAETKLAKGGKPATIDQVAAGDAVQGAYVEKDGQMNLLTLRVVALGQKQREEKH